MIELPEAEFNSLTSGETLAALNRLNDACGKLVLERLRQSADAAQDGRNRAREFRQWVDFREYKDPSTRQLFDDYFTNFMDMLDRESVTPTDRQELSNVRQLFASKGFAVFLVHFEKALLEVYNADNFRTARETELRASLDRRKNEMIKDIVDAVARALPARE